MKNQQIKETFQTIIGSCLKISQIVLIFSSSLFANLDTPTYIFRIETDQTVGTAFVGKVEDQDYLITASHVLQGRKKARLIQVSSNRTFEDLPVIYDNPDEDLAVLKCPSPFDVHYNSLSIVPKSESNSIAYVESYFKNFGPFLTSSDENSLEIYGIAGKGASGAPVVNNNNDFLGIYQRFQYAGFQSFYLSSTRVFSLIVSKPRPKIYWENYTRKYSDSNLTVEELNNDFISLSLAAGGIGKGAGGIGKGAGGIGKGADGIGKGAGGIGKGAGGIGKGAGGIGKGEDDQENVPYLIVPIHNFNLDNSELVPTDIKFYVPLKPFEYRLKVNGVLRYVPDMGFRDRLDLYVDFLKKSLIENPKWIEPIKNVQNNFELKPKQILDENMTELSETQYVDLNKTDEKIELHTHNRNYSRSLYLEISEDKATLKYTLDGRTYSYVDFSKGLARVFTSSESPYTIVVRLSSNLNKISIVIFDKENLEKRGELWMLEN